MLATSTCPSDHLTIEVFAADARPDLTALYRAGQAESYRRYPGSLAALLPGSPAGAWIVLARARAGDALAGMRVHLRRPHQPLPVERALGERCPLALVLDAAPQPLVELCGTWVSGARRGGELAALVTRAALALARHHGARRIVGCAHQHVLDFYRRFGARVDERLGVHPYPDPRYQTQVFWADPDADTAERPAILTLAASLARGEPLTALA